MNNYTDEQLKQALAKMLPETLALDGAGNLFWRDSNIGSSYTGEVLDTELLHLCWLVEESLTPEQRGRCAEYSYRTHVGIPEYHQDYHATWQQRIIALAKTLGIEIV